MADEKKCFVWLKAESEKAGLHKTTVSNPQQLWQLIESHVL